MEEALSTSFLTGDRLNEALVRMNLLKNREPRDPEIVELLEGAVEALFDASRHLIAYGTLAPGGPNHGLLAGLEGEWVEGWVTGELLERGWSAAMSYPALRWCPVGGEIPAFLFASDDLPEIWTRLDEFEGLEYERIWAPFFSPEGDVRVGNLYAMECDPGQ